MTDEQLRFRKLFEGFVNYHGAWGDFERSPGDETFRVLTQRHRSLAAMLPGHPALSELGRVVDRCSHQVGMTARDLKAETPASNALLADLHADVNRRAAYFPADAREILRQKRYIGPSFDIANDDASS